MIKKLIKFEQGPMPLMMEASRRAGMSFCAFVRQATLLLTMDALGGGDKAGQDVEEEIRREVEAELQLSAPCTPPTGER